MTLTFPKISWPPQPIPTNEAKVPPLEGVILITAGVLRRYVGTGTLMLPYFECKKCHKTHTDTHAHILYIYIAYIYSLYIYIHVYHLGT